MKIKAYAVVDKNGKLLHRNGGSPSIFIGKEGKKTAEFLAYDWIDQKDRGYPYEVWKCFIEIL